MINLRYLFYFQFFCVFFVLIKNLYLVFVIFYENYIIYKIKLANGSKLFNKYINSPYSFFIKSNPSTFIRNLSGELDRSHLFILQYFTIIRGDTFNFIYFWFIILFKFIYYFNCFNHYYYFCSYILFFIQKNFN